MLKWISPALVLTLAMLPLASSAMNAQEQARFDRLERRLMAMENKVFSGEAEEQDSLDPATLADFEIRLSQIEEESRKLYGAVEELGYSVEQLVRKVDLIAKDMEMRMVDIENAVEGKSAPVETQADKEARAAAQVKQDIPAEIDPDQLYQKAYNYLTTASYPQAKQWFEAFLERFPNHQRADNSHYWLGEISLVEDDLEKAVIAFSNGLKAFPKGQKAPANFLKMGVALKRLGREDHARSTWKKLIKDFPDAPESEKAKKQLESM